MANYVSKDGLLYFWTLLKAKINNKSEIGHTHTSDDVTTMGTYSKGSATSAIATTDTLNQAIGKLEKRVDGKQGSLSTAQLNACNSGITSTKVSTYDGYATTINGKANSSDVYTKTEIDSKLTSAMRYKGSKASASALPTTGNVIGDMWNVTDTGANYVWDGSAWDETGMVIDLSPYAKTSDLVAVTNTEIDTIVAS